MEMGGQSQFPYMVDPNTKTSMYESDDIISYLFESYGEGSKASRWVSDQITSKWGYYGI